MDDADGVRALGVVVPVAAEGAGDEHGAVVEVPVLADRVDTSLGRHGAYCTLWVQLSESIAVSFEDLQSIKNIFYQIKHLKAKNNV